MRLAEGNNGMLPASRVWDLCIQSKHGQFKLQGAVLLSNQALNELVVFSPGEVEIKPGATQLEQLASVQVYRLNPVHNGKSVDPAKYERMLVKVNKRDGGTFKSYTYSEDHEWVWSFDHNCSSKRPSSTTVAAG